MKDSRHNDFQRTVEKADKKIEKGPCKKGGDDKSKIVDSMS